MGSRLYAVILTALLFYEAAGFSIRSEALGRCVQVQDGRLRARVVLEQCSPGSALQEWQWLPESHALSSLHSGECLSALRGRVGGVHHHAVRLGLHPCAVDPGPETGGAKEEEEGSSSRESQAWACTKEGHLTLRGKGLHLSTRQDSKVKVFLSKEPPAGPASEWRTIGNGSICGERDRQDRHRHHRPHRHSEATLTVDSARSASSASITDGQQQPMDGGGADSDTADRDPGGELSPPLSDRESTLSSEDPTVAFFTIDYGFGWKVTMLVLSSVALVLGTVILILSIYNNRKKKVVCVLKSYTPTGDVSQPGSPVPSERAPLTRHPMRPARSPSLQRGEILIEWKDGTVTPLFDSFLAD